jgi:hypothetical protein
MPLALVSYLALPADSVLRSEPAIVRGVATKSAKVLLTMLGSSLLPVSVIVRTALLFAASSSVRESMLRPQMALLLVIVQPKLLFVEWSSVQASTLQPQ